MRIPPQKLLLNKMTNVGHLVKLYFAIGFTNLLTPQHQIVTSSRTLKWVCKDQHRLNVLGSLMVHLKTIFENHVFCFHLTAEHCIVSVCHPIKVLNFLVVVKPEKGHEYFVRSCISERLYAVLSEPSWSLWLDLRHVTHWLTETRHLELMYLWIISYMSWT